MVFEFIELIIFIVAAYGAALEWVRVRDAKSHNKWDFYIPAGFLIFVIFVMFSSGFHVGSLLSVSSLVCGVAALPLLISLLHTGSKQDAQLAAGDPLYNKGVRWWLLAEQRSFRESFSRFQGDALNGWSEVKEARMGQGGVITKVFHDRTVTLEFDDGDKFDFPFESLVHEDPLRAEDESEGKAWWK